ncbi:blue light receptor, partial [Entophlyctis luteolus]
KELAQFLLMAKAGSRDALAGCAVRCRFSGKVHANTPANVRPFVPESALPLDISDLWRDVEIGFNIASRDSLLVFVMDRNAPSLGIIGPNQDITPRSEIDIEDIKSLRELMAKQAVGLHQLHAKPNLFLTICDASILRVLYTSSTSKLAYMKVPTNISVDFSKTNIGHYFGSVTTHQITQQLHKPTSRNSYISRIFSLQHSSARTPQAVNHESIFIDFCDLLFIVTRVPDISADDSPPPNLIPGIQQPIQQAFPRFPIPDSVSADKPRFVINVMPDSNNANGTSGEKRSMRPWEDEEQQNSGGNEQKRFVIETPVFTAPSPAHAMPNGSAFNNRDQRAFQIQQQQHQRPMHGLQRIPSVANLVSKSSIPGNSALKRIHSDSRLHSRLKYELNEDSMTPLLAAVQYTQQQKQHQAPMQMNKLVHKAPARYSPSHPSVGSGGSESMQSSPRQSATFSGFPQHAFQKPTAVASMSTPAAQSPLAPNTTGSAGQSAEATAVAAAAVLAAITHVPPKSDNDDDEYDGDEADDDEYDDEDNSASPPSGGHGSRGRSMPGGAPRSASIGTGAAAPNEFGDDSYPKPPRRPLKTGVCRKCGITESREWRRGPHGPKTLCNACGLRFKRKPWDIQDEADANAACNA